MAIKAPNVLGLNFLNKIDVGIMVVTGSSDMSQQKIFQQLKKNSRIVFVVLNKIDEWDHLDPPSVVEVENQWKDTIGLNISEPIYRTCVKNYDPRSRADAPIDIRGVDELRTAIFNFLKKEGKDLMLKRICYNKREYAIGIIVTAVLSSAAEAFIPGSAVYITATQTVAIISLVYLYTGRIITKKEALAVLPTIIGRTIGQNLFLVIKSFFPPTLVLDAIAAGIAAAVTAALLVAVSVLLENGFSVEESARLANVFQALHRASQTMNWTGNIGSGIDSLFQIGNKSLAQNHEE